MLNVNTNFLITNFINGIKKAYNFIKFFFHERNEQIIANKNISFKTEYHAILLKKTKLNVIKL